MRDQLRVELRLRHGRVNGDTIEAASPWTYVGLTENGGGTSGSLTFANGGADISFMLLGGYNASLFHTNVTGTIRSSLTGDGRHPRYRTGAPVPLGGGR